ncbi:MAG: hypothetical protein QOJ16_3682 [Acidobacteriota bacterium]|jgi:hypothetical protein|nr:hypothetical protein [Acidobacteriota bacterium]
MSGFFSVSFGMTFRPIPPGPGQESVWAMEACFVDGERVQAQEGDFYGGWITKEIVGPFKGAPGTGGW